MRAAARALSLPSFSLWLFSADEPREFWLRKPQGQPPDRALMIQRANGWSFSQPRHPGRVTSRFNLRNPLTFLLGSWIMKAHKRFCGYFVLQPSTPSGFFNKRNPPNAGAEGGYKSCGTPWFSGLSPHKIPRGCDAYILFVRPLPFPAIRCRSHFAVGSIRPSRTVNQRTDRQWADRQFEAPLYDQRPRRLHGELARLLQNGAYRANRCFASSKGVFRLSRFRRRGERRLASVARHGRQLRARIRGFAAAGKHR